MNTTFGSRYQWDKLLFSQLLGAILVVSLFHPALSGIWVKIDTACFRFLNNPLRESDFLCQFWAIANHKFMDWVEDILFLGLAGVYYFSPSDKSQARKIAEMVFAFLTIAMVILLVNRCLFISQTCNIPRMSPTLTLDHPVRLSEYVSWLKVKDFSYKSFPGDHATTAILYAILYTYYAGARLGVNACLLSLFFCLPRLVVGAHWLSDVVVGSFSIVLFFLSILLFTPLEKKIIDYLEQQFAKVKTGKFLP